MERVASYGRERRAGNGPLVLSHAHLLQIESSLPEIQMNLALENVALGEISGWYCVDIWQRRCRGC